MADNTPNQKPANIAETLAKELKSPIVIPDPIIDCLTRVAHPPGWQITDFNDEKYRDAPIRKKATVRLTDTPSFIDYIKRHGSLTTSTTWCNVDYSAGTVKFTGIINDHGETEDEPAWRDHKAMYQPEFSEEWKRWTTLNKEPFSQALFAAFIEENLKDIVSVDGSPSGSQMLAMAINFEANQDMKFKSAIRLQSGGVNMSFIQTDDAQTIAQMEMFDRFTLGMPVFWGGDAYPVSARLRYRQREGKLTFYYELIRQDKVLEAATQTIIKTIRETTGNPFFFGDPFAG